MMNKKYSTSIYRVFILVVGLLIGFLPNQALGQLEQTARMEVPTSMFANEQFDLFSLGEAGALMVTRRSDYVDRKSVV